MWKLWVRKQLCERRMQVLGSPLKSLMCFLLRKSMPCFHKWFVNPHLLMVLILGLGIFLLTIFSFVAVLNFKMWGLKNLLWFNYLMVWYWSFVEGFKKNWCINVTKCSSNWHQPIIDYPILNVISTPIKLACQCPLVWPKLGFHPFFFIYDLNGRKPMTSSL